MSGNGFIHIETDLPQLRVDEPCDEPSHQRASLLAGLGSHSGTVAQDDTIYSDAGEQHHAALSSLNCYDYTPERIAVHHHSATSNNWQHGISQGEPPASFVSEVHHPDGSRMNRGQFGNAYAPGYFNCSPTAYHHPDDTSADPFQSSPSSGFPANTDGYLQSPAQRPTYSDGALTSPSSLGSGEHVCPICPRAFERGTDMRRHVKQVHQHAEKGFYCPHDGCEKAFYWNKDCLRHAATHEPAPKVGCDRDLCTSSFSLNRRDNMKRHYRRKHRMTIYHCPVDLCPYYTTDSEDLEGLEQEHDDDGHGVWPPLRTITGGPTGTVGVPMAAQVDTQYHQTATQLASTSLGHSAAPSYTVPQNTYYNAGYAP